MENNRGDYILELEAKVRILESQIDRLKKWIFEEIGKEPPESLLSENVEDYSGDQDEVQDQSEDDFIGPDPLYDNDDTFIDDVVQEFDLENVKLERINDDEYEDCQEPGLDEQPQQDNDMNDRVVRQFTISKSQKGKDIISEGGYSYIFERDGSEGKKIWRCTKWNGKDRNKCKGRCHTLGNEILASTSHNHFEDSVGTVSSGSEAIALQFIKTRTGKPALVHEGFVFIFDKKGSAGKKLWRCIKYCSRKLDKCPGRCHTNSKKVIFHTDNHNHPPEPEPIDVDKYASKKSKTKTNKGIKRPQRQKVVQDLENVKLEMIKDNDDDEYEDCQEQGLDEQPQQDNDKNDRVVRQFTISISQKGKDIITEGGYSYIFERDGSEGKKIWRCTKWNGKVRNNCKGRCHTLGNEILASTSHNHFEDSVGSETTTLQFVKTEKGKPALIHDGFIFTFDKHGSGGKKIWRCFKWNGRKQENCHGRCHTDSEKVIFHQDNHNHPRDPIEVERYSLKYITKKDLQGQDGRNICPICSKEFKFYAKLKIHMNIHDQNREKNSLCPYCAKSFYEESHVKRHITQVHPEHTNNPQPENVEQLCGLCGKIYENESKLYSHMKYHEKKRRDCQTFICSFCGAKLKSAMTFKAHMNLHTREKTWKCTYPQCAGSGKVYLSHSYLKLHILRIHNKNAPTFQCDFPGCSRSFKLKSVLNWHKDIHNKERSHVCKYCSKVIKSNNTLKSHIAKYHRQDRSDLDYPFKCQACGQKFKEERWLKVHFECTHGEKPKLTCPHKETHGCKNEFLNKKTLHLHLKWRHQLAGVRPFVCEIDNCNKNFQTKARLTVHQETHMNKEERNYKCKYCPDTFSSRTVLGGHIRKFHRAARNLRLKCQIENCGQTFSSTKFLEDHVETHNPDYDPYKYKCSICSKAYKIATERNRHEKVVHQTGRPFVCHCGKDFKRKQHLQRHQAQTHEGIGKNETRKRKAQDMSSDFFDQDS